MREIPSVSVREECFKIALVECGMTLVPLTVWQQVHLHVQGSPEDTFFFKLQGNQSNTSSQAPTKNATELSRYLALYLGFDVLQLYSWCSISGVGYPFPIHICTG